MRTINAIFSQTFITALAIVGCSSPTGDLNGDVFIVTEGGQNVRMGLVDVRAISEQSLRTFVKRREEDLKDELQKRHLEIAEAQRRADAALEDLTRATRFSI